MKERLYYLDVLRGIAAIIVACFYHYKHFSDFIQPNSTGHIPPFYSVPLFKFIFDMGDLIVDMFFVFSGIIFSYTYRQRIQNRQTNTFDFFVKRLSRLYPVHLLTLLLTACIVYPFYQIFKTYPIYLHNNFYYFVLNVLFLQKGFIDTGYSFNGPAWSLSIEVLMYTLFFIQAKRFKAIYSSILFLLLGLVICWFLPFRFRFLLNDDVSRGLMGFFSGCLLYELVLKKPFYTYIKYVYLPIFACIYIIYLIWFRSLIYIPSNIQIIVILIVIIPYLHHSVFIQKYSKINWLLSLGDISLSVYLIHAPIQMLIIFYYRLADKTIQYNSPIFLFIYSLSILLFGYVLHYRFERPIQIRLRKALLSYKFTNASLVSDSNKNPDQY